MRVPVLLLSMLLLSPAAAQVRVTGGDGLIVIERDGEASTYSYTTSSSGADGQDAGAARVRTVVVYEVGRLPQFVLNPGQRRARELRDFNRFVLSPLLEALPDESHHRHHY